jgi:cation diffusion facilitator family transporter
VTVTKPAPTDTVSLDRQHFAMLSIGAAVLVIGMKLGAWWITGSVGLLSDALESFVNLAGALFALWMILLTQQPPDDEHQFGHAKAEYFASAFEGMLIFGAAAIIIWVSVGRLLDPRPLQALGWGLLLVAASTAINLAVSITLRRAGTRLKSIALEADARHLMTDVYTSVGVMVGVTAVWATGWLVLDPIIALLVGVNILVEGVRLIRMSVDGLMDRSLDEDDQARLRAALESFATREVRWSHLRTRRAGTEAWIDVHVRVPGDWTVAKGHDVLDEVEASLRHVMPGATVMTHLEPREDGQPQDREDRT